MRVSVGMCWGLMVLATAAPLALRAQFPQLGKEDLAMTADAKAPGADAVYLFRQEKEDDPHHFLTVMARMKVLTEKGKEVAVVHVANQLNFVFNAAGDNSSGGPGSSSQNYWSTPDIMHSGADATVDAEGWIEKVEVGAISGRTIHPDGTVIPLNVNSSEMMKVIKQNRQGFSDISFTLPGVEVGSVIEYSYQIRYDRYQLAPIWHIQTPYFTHKARFQLTPSEQFLPDRTKGGSGVSSATLRDVYGESLTDLRATPLLPTSKTVAPDPMGIYTLEMVDIPPIAVEPFAPPLTGKIFQVDFAYVATLEERDFWQKEMRNWNRAITQVTSPTAAIQEAVAHQTAGATNEEERARLLYGLVQSFENREAAGKPVRKLMYGAPPRTSSDTILKHKSGNSEELALLYLALVKAAGLNAHAERISSRDRQIFTPAILSANQLDAILIVLEIEGQKLVVDPGAKMAPFRTLKWSHAFATGIALSADGKTTEVVNTPSQLPTENTTVRVGNLQVGEKGEVSGTLKIGMSGQRALELRQIAVRSGDEAAKEALSQMLAGKLPEGAQAKVDRIAGLDDPNRQLTAVVAVSGTVGKQVGDQWILPRVFFESRAANPFPETPVRNYPVDMRFPEQVQDQIGYVLPQGWKVAAAPADAKQNWDNNAVYQLRSKIEGATVTNARVLARGFTMLDTSVYPQLRDFYQKIVANDQQTLTLTKN